MTESIEEPIKPDAANPETPVEAESDQPLVDRDRADLLLKSSASVLKAAATLSQVTASIIDPAVLKEKQDEIDDKAERRKAQLREAQATFVQKTKAEAEEQALKLRRLEAEVAAIEGLHAELATLRPVASRLQAAQAALAFAQLTASRWRMAAGGLAALAILLAVALAM
jgi:hypothetical protein